MTSDDTTLKDFTSQIDKLNERMTTDADAPEGAVRRDGDRAQQLADAAGLAHEPDLLAAALG